MNHYHAAVPCWTEVKQGGTEAAGLLHDQSGAMLLCYPPLYCPLPRYPLLYCPLLYFLLTYYLLLYYLVLHYLLLH